MLSLQRFVAFIVVLSVFISLPLAGHCDTSYYEKYYAARRFVPLKRTSLLQHNFTVTLKDETLKSFEQVALVGGVKQLGAWSANDAVFLNRSDVYNVWTGSVNLPLNTSINYRYFIAAVDNDTRSIHIRRWESSLNARQFQTTRKTGNRSDIFGWIDATQREVQRGWLNAGNIVQFKLFRNPLQIYELRNGSEQVRIKVQPIEPQMLTPILPSARAYTEYVRMEYGNSFLNEQPEFGVPYLENDILMFHTTLCRLQQVAYLLKVYASQEGSDLVRLIGYQYLYADALQGSEGSVNVNIISPVWLSSIGTLQLQYLVMAPLPNASINFRTTFVDYWRSNWTQLDVGHRGLGKSLKQTTNAAPVNENTVASMKAATELGTDMVEFDVQLTRDFIPIIYHDYFIYVCMDSKTPRSKDDLTVILIKDVTYEQLKNLKTFQVVSDKVIEYPAHNTVEEEDERLFPLFEDFLTKINKSVGFDIEIKWPQLKYNGEWESVQTIDKNVYIDSILHVMQVHGCGRLSFFTSFDADICSLLRFKQNMYPVMFLFSSKESNFADPRSDTIYDIVNNAQAFDLAGIVPNAVFIQRNPGWMAVAERQQKKVFLWGDVIKDRESIAWFKAQNPAGVIYDRLDLWLPSNKQNAFEHETDLPQFFQLQCDQQDDNGNSTDDGALNNYAFF